MLLLKTADHASDRFQERLPQVPTAILDHAREVAKKIPPGPENRMHMPLTHEGKPVGFAAYKRVGKNGKPVLATILGPTMIPRNSHLLNAQQLLDEVEGQKTATSLLIEKLPPRDPNVPAQFRQGIDMLDGAYVPMRTVAPEVQAQLPPGKKGVFLRRPASEIIPPGPHPVLGNVTPEMSEMFGRSATRHELTHYLRDRMGKLDGLGQPGVRNVLRTAREEAIAYGKGLKPFEKNKALLASMAAGIPEGILKSTQSAYAPKGGVLRGGVFGGTLKPLTGLAERLGILKKAYLYAEKTADVNKERQASQEPAEEPKTAATKTRLFAGLRVRIDRPKGYVQKGKDRQGNPWTRTYLCDYGYLAGTQGGDGDGMDVFLGPKEDGKAFLFTQHKDDGSFDEYKLLLGFPDLASARAMYEAHVPKKYVGASREIPLGVLQGLTGRPVDHAKTAQVVFLQSFHEALGG